MAYFDLNYWKSASSVGGNFVDNLRKNIQNFQKQPIRQQGESMAASFGPAGMKKVGVAPKAPAAKAAPQKVWCPWCKGKQKPGDDSTSKICPSCMSTFKKNMGR